MLYSEAAIIEVLSRWAPEMSNQVRVAIVEDLRRTGGHAIFEDTKPVYQPVFQVRPENMTDLDAVYSVDQFNRAMAQVRIVPHVRDLVREKLKRMDPIAKPGVLTLPEQLCDHPHRYSESEIRSAINTAFQVLDYASVVPANVQVIRGVVEHLELMRNVRRTRVDEIRISDKNKRMCLASADKPEWKLFTHMTTIGDDEDKKAILVLDGEAVICDGEVPIDIDDRKVTDE